MRLIVLRHTKTFYNESGKLQGQVDILPTEAGMKDCLKVKEILKNYSIDFALTSPLSRAKITASLVTDAPILVEERLNERSLGVYEGKGPETYDLKKYSSYYLNDTFGGVEGIRNLCDRVKSLLEDMKKYEDKTILWVTHGGLIKVIPYCIKGIPEDGMITSPPIKNLEFIEYTI